MMDYRIAVEMQPTGTPKPTGFGVLADGRPVAFLTEEQVRASLAKFDDMKRSYQAQAAAADPESLNEDG